MGIPAISAGPERSGTLTEQDKLIAKLNAVLEQDQRNVEAFLGRANAYLDLGRYRGVEREHGPSNGPGRTAPEPDDDTLLLKMDPAGPACHTGERSCFFRRL